MQHQLRTLSLLTDPSKVQSAIPIAIVALWHHPSSEKKVLRILVKSEVSLEINQDS